MVKIQETNDLTCWFLPVTLLRMYTTFGARWDYGGLIVALGDHGMSNFSQNSKPRHSGPRGTLR